MMKSKQKIIIALLSFLVCTILFVGVVAYPIFQGVVEDHKKVLEYKREFLQMKEDMKNSHEFEIISSQYAQEFLQLEEFFVDSKTPIAFFRFLDETATLFNLQIEKAPGPVQQQKGDRWPSFEVRLAGDGLYPDVMAFLQKVENAPYLLEAQTLTISAGKEIAREQNQGEVEFSLSVKVFTK